jgi:putative endonuclease
MKQGFVYMMSNKNRNVIYIGVTNDIEIRTLQHKRGTGSVFTSKYNCKFLIYYEHYWDIMHAIEREKQLKNWHKEWKLNLAKTTNPELIDLSSEWFDETEI